MSPTGFKTRRRLDRKNPHESRSLEIRNIDPQDDIDGRSVQLGVDQNKLGTLPGNTAGYPPRFAIRMPSRNPPGAMESQNQSINYYNLIQEKRKFGSLT